MSAASAAHRRRRLSGLARDRDGAIAPLTAFAIVALVAFAGIATDTARGYFLKSRLTQALDAAALAGGKVFFEDTRDADIQKYFSANLPNDYMDATIDGPHITPESDSDGDKLTLSASATIPTTFMRVLGRTSMSVASEVQVTRQTAYLDVVLAIDLSTSMTYSAGATTRIEAAKAAATTLTNILFGDNATKDLLKIAVVPWSAKVNITNKGVTFNSAQTTTQSVTTFKNPISGSNQSVLYYANNAPTVPLLSAPQSTWKGCVYARYRWGQSVTSTQHADTVINLAQSGTYGTWKGYEPIKSTEAEPVSGSSECSQAGSSNTECTPCFNQGITRLTNTKQTVLDAISALAVLSAEQSSYTNLPQGLLWGWNVITPEAPFTDADANPQGTRIQAIVFLTDGENQRQYGDAYKRTLTNSELNTRVGTIATNIKTAGIKIYAIQFGDNPTQTQEDLMKGIASDPDSSYYFYAPDADSLNSVFTDVANSLTQLRLSK